MIKQSTLISYLDKLLKVKTVKDYCPNGLQIEGKKEIKTIVLGVSACIDLIEAAINKKADAIIVHHGYFWKGENRSITGINYRRIKLLLQHEINLIAYHLPLDIHPVLGNNVQLARLLNLPVISTFNTDTMPSYGILCKTTLAMTLKSLIDTITLKLKRPPLVVGNTSQEQIYNIAICTGGAQGFIEHAYNSGAEVYISGEISERTTLIARELGITYIAAGHHATERYGAQAVGNHLKECFDVSCHFIDIENPA